MKSFDVTVLDPAAGLAAQRDPSNGWLSRILLQERRLRTQSIRLLSTEWSVLFSESMQSCKLWAIS